MIKTISIQHNYTTFNTQSQEVSHACFLALPTLPLIYVLESFSQLFDWHCRTSSLEKNSIILTFATIELPIPPPSTYFFSISNNQFTREMPPAICSLSILQILDLSNNNLSGNFSKSFSILDQWKNKFHGVIPKAFSMGNVLRNLDLNGYHLEWPLPSSLLTCRELEVLDLENNKIHDTFPN
ncbi:hypothetical protein Prudu_012571 [Prunus dulcis]|uniref:Uncharacterized protein n=1 Tax=Prunus dulcis TaxID=3755 RepID=A0A4Y1RDM4_PRUDU|nr:hypothetical protein Prudu_012571 [Prunus dulcis]